MKKLLLTAALGMGVLASARADTTLYVVGSTAFRGNFYNALNTAANWTAAPTVVGASGDSAFSFKGTWNRNDTGGLAQGTVLKVYCSWSGSVEGMLSILVPDNPTFVQFADEGGGTFTHNANVAFSDVYQSTTGYAPSYGYATLGDVIVGIQPFVFVGNDRAVYTNGLFNVSLQNFDIMAPNGRLALAYFVGGSSPDYSTQIYLTGRNSFSGTRTTTFAETGYGVFTSCKQYRNGTTTLNSLGRLDRVADIANVVLFPLNDGWDSGKWVRADLQNAANTTDSLIGYLSSNDARTLKGTVAASAASYLKYDGYAYTKASVIDGQYTFWCNEHVMVNSPAGSDPAKAQVSFQKAIDANLLGAYCTDDYPGAIPLSAMQVSRTKDGGPVQ
jgi:hypothetical protein